ncbi:MAG: FlgO family outer membrane protein [Arcobacter sp.]|uniref:FlgO family outer membrane protein n=1 Tax=Arcobacter sp. TaxID=1872629 RepID=UPI003CFF111D
MVFKLLRISKLFLVSFFLTLFFTSCSYKNPISGSNNFHSLISGMVDESANKIKKNVSNGEVVLVSDFVNLDKLKNKSQLGFLLSSMLKDKLSSLDIIVKEIELGKEFEFGPSGFNLLTREKDKIVTNKVKSKYAVVGTYSISSRSLNVFIKLIDIQTGNILSSSYGRTDVDEEILGLEGTLDKKVLPPQRPYLFL